MLLSLKLENKLKIILICVIASVILVGIVFTLIFGIGGNRKMIVGKDVKIADITEFFYTCSSSSYPPSFFRYHFSIEDDKYMYHYEKREGKSWPLSEENITDSVSVELSHEDWEKFFDCLDGGILTKRSENISDGGKSKDIFMYCKGELSNYQEFSFETHSKEKVFDELCKSFNNY